MIDCWPVDCRHPKKAISIRSVLVERFANRLKFTFGRVVVKPKPTASKWIPADLFGL